MDMGAVINKITIMPDKEAKAPYKLGLALAGGGARGFAHLGAFEAIEELGLKPDIISGTSAGSLAGVFYADGYTPQETLKLFKNVKFTELATTSLPRNSFFKMNGLRTFLKENIRAKTFEELRIPLRVMTSNIETGESILFDKGELIEPILASCAVPIVFEPIEIGGKYLVDGGLFVNLPASVIRDDCEKLIGINISPLCPQKYNRSFKYIIERSLHYLMVANALPDRDICDYLIESTEIGKFPLFDLNKAAEIYKTGYIVAKQTLEKNKERIKQDFFSPIKQEPALSFLQRLANAFRK